MTASGLTRPPGDAQAGRRMHELIAELYPLCRSITGDGVRATLQRLGRQIPLTIHEVPTGTPVFDWTVPREWNIRDAWVKDSTGRRVIDFQRSNLHVVHGSVPVRARMRLEALRGRLFTLPEQPDRIPYRTAYYQDDTWGFCLTHRRLLELADDEYEVVIDATLAPGHLTYGECYLPGDSPAEVLVSTHVCHPSLANDNLSGIAVATFLAERLAAARRRYSYRFLFAPGTIGSITWLARNEERVADIRHGLVLACVGDGGRITYKRSRRGTAPIDRVVAHVLRASGEDHEIVDFSPYGYDERQFCSPGFDLPVGCFTRTRHGRFPEYHTSADDLDFVRPEELADSLDKLRAVVAVLERDGIYLNQNPKCEPQLGRRGLYRVIGGDNARAVELAMLWVLSFSDGAHSLLDIAERSGCAFDAVWQAAQALLGHGLLKEAA